MYTLQGCVGVYACKETAHNLVARGMRHAAESIHRAIFHWSRSYNGKVISERRMEQGRRKVYQLKQDVP